MQTSQTTPKRNINKLSNVNVNNHLGDQINFAFLTHKVTSKPKPLISQSETKSSFIEGLCSVSPAKSPSVHSPQLQNTQRSKTQPRIFPEIARHATYATTIAITIDTLIQYTSSPKMRSIYHYLEQLEQHLPIKPSKWDRKYKIAIFCVAIVFLIMAIVAFALHDRVSFSSLFYCRRVCLRCLRWDLL